MKQKFWGQIINYKKGHKLKVGETKWTNAAISKTESSSPHETASCCHTGYFFNNEVARSWKSLTPMWWS